MYLGSVNKQRNLFLYIYIFVHMFTNAIYVVSNVFQFQ